MANRLIPVLLALLASASAFNPRRWSILTDPGDGHFEQSQKAIDEAAFKFLTAYGARQGTPIPNGLERKVSKYCSAVGLACRGYALAMTRMGDANALVDYDYPNLVRYHFDAESFVEGNTMLIKDKQAIFQQINGSQSYESARLVAGTILHAVQDFYSHSNWVEMNQTSYHRKLTRQVDIGRTAGPNEATCYDCSSLSGDLSCYNNILERILQEGILTTGYYGGQDIEKPPGVGKCSHGGNSDTSASVHATGGINKDYKIATISPHHYYQVEAANVAYLASYHFFLDLWDIIGDDHFGKFLSLTESASTIFIVDVTDSKILGQSLWKIKDLMAIRPDIDEFFLITVGHDSFQVKTLKNLQTPTPNEISSSGEINPSIFPAAIVESVRLGSASKEIFLLPSRPLPENECQNLKKRLQSSRNHQPFTLTNLGISSACYDQLNLDIRSKSDNSSTDVTVLLFSNMAEASLAFTVEKGLVNLVVAIDSGTSSQISNVAMVTPTGSTLRPDTENLPHSVKFHISDPTPGEYSLTVEFTGHYSISVMGQSNLSPWVQLGIFEKGFLASIESEPLSDFNGSVVVNVGSSYQGPEIYDVTIQLVGPNGFVFSQVPATGNHEGEFMANITTPSAGDAFQVLVRGSITGDVNGFQRMTSLTYTPVPFVVATTENADPKIDSIFLQVSVPLPVTFIVTYSGDSNHESMQITAKVNQPGIVISSIEPDQLVLSSSNSSQFFVVTLSTENSSLIGSAVTLEVFATDSQNRSNFLIRRFAVMPTVIDVVPPQFDKVHYDDSACSNLPDSLCQTEKWTARASLYDSENGIHHYTLRILRDLSPNQNGTASLEVSNFEKGKVGAVADAELLMDCCVAEIELIAIDTQGNLNSQYFNMLSVISQPESGGTEWWVYLLAVVSALILLAATGATTFFAVKRYR